MFERLIHADWSISPTKRWAAQAQQQDGRWQVAMPIPVGPVPELLDRVCTAGKNERVLLGFDFPIGLPSAYGMLTGFRSFREAFPAFGSGPWSAFFDVCENGADVSLHRPFYRKRCEEAHLPTRPLNMLGRLGVGSFEPALWSTLATT